MSWSQIKDFEPSELERLRADLATIQKAAKIAKKQGWHKRTGNYDQVELEIKGKIADLEAQQVPVDEWSEVKRYIDQSPDKGSNTLVKRYIRHLEAKVAELDHELRCERIDGGKVRDDQKAFDAEKNREKLAELTTIANVIPPACGIFFYSEQFRETLELARELVERRIEGIKREMQGNGN